MQTRCLTALLTCILLGLVPSLSRAQTASADTPTPIVTDRPTVTDSSVVVPLGSLQAENGFLDTDSQGRSVVDGPETLVRFGLTTRTELRFTAPDYYYNLSTGGGPGSGFGDLAIGVKQQLGPTPGGFDVSLVASLSFPTGAAGVSSGGYDPGLQLPWSHSLWPKWTAAGMFSLYWPTEGSSRDLTGESTFLLDWQPVGRWDLIAEYVGDFPERGGTRSLLHLATELRMGKRQLQQVDFHYGVGLSSSAVDHFVGVGYSFRLQAIHH